eukprot:6098299-Pyramimonas_sp.AAC.1
MKRDSAGETELPLRSLRAPSARAIAYALRFVTAALRRSLLRPGAAPPPLPWAALSLTRGPWGAVQ